MPPSKSERGARLRAPPPRGVAAAPGREGRGAPRRRNTGLAAGGVVLVLVLLVVGLYWFTRSPGTDAAADGTASSARPTPARRRRARSRRRPAASRGARPATAQDAPGPARSPPRAATSASTSTALRLRRPWPRSWPWPGGFFNGTPCHRLTTEGIYVLQCGDPPAGTGGRLQLRPCGERPRRRRVPAGTIAMAARAATATARAASSSRLP